MARMDSEVATAAAVATLARRAIGDRCPCAAWAVNIEKVNAPFVTAFARNPGSFPGYTGTPFGYCPWCGSGLAAVKTTTRGEVLNAVREAETAGGGE